ncbi:helix-turn-helix domain-containing protein [Dyadobacter aurulentus]|uniref:helix-turn-helix domain-containing protein n=1 Tax=Dyadobacter sp. UC 10 TaxID=2605428 RepID=UPI0011F1E26F|nr:helix-turn-helix transcriptional regulator [Dyadobacter sp. UC 10]KAA0992750.1 helix-turn-helix transcriptional regulator [Dyadobacter sp. UC 10]
MKTVPIGVIIKDIVQKKNLSPARLADKTGLSRQAVYNTYSRTTMNEAELERWADALGVTMDDLTNAGSDFNAGQASIKADDVMSLMRKMFEEELKEKNDQIRALQKALEQAQNLSTALLGKSPEHSDADVLPHWTIIINGADAIERPLWPDGIQHATA